MLGGSAFALSPTGSPPSISDRIDTLLKARQWQGATQLLQNAIKQDPKNMLLRTWLMNWAILTNNTQAAQSLVFDTLKVYPKSPESLYLRGYSITGPLVNQPVVDRTNPDTTSPQPNSAKVNALSPLVPSMRQIDDLSPQTRYVEGELALQDNDTAYAEEQFLRALYQAPNDLWSVQALANLYLNEGFTRRATPLVLQSRDLAPNDVDTWYLLGRLYLLKEDPEKALEAFAQSQQLDPVASRPTRDYWIQKTQQQLGLAPPSPNSAPPPVRPAKEPAPLDPALAAKAVDIPQKRPANQVTIPNRPGTRPLTPLAERATAPESKPMPRVIPGTYGALEQAWWNGNATDAQQTLNQLTASQPTRLDLLYLNAVVGYYNWQNGEPDSAQSRQALQSNLYKQQSTSLSPWLQLADIQTQIIEQDGMTPELKQATRQLIQSSQSPLLRTEANLLLGCVDSAADSYDREAFNLSRRQELIELASLGANDWLLPLYASLPASEQSPELQQWLLDWSRQRNDELLDRRKAVLENIQNGQLDNALTQLLRLRVQDSLNPNVHLMLADLAYRKKRFALARQSLNNAKATVATVQERAALKVLETKLTKSGFPSSYRDDDMPDCP